MTDALYERQSWLIKAAAELKPTFVGSRDVGGADADLIADRCLIEVKAAVNLAKIGRRWPWRLLGYALLDYDDAYEIDSLGLYLPRQGMLIQWPLDEYASRLAGQPVTVAELRNDLRHALAADPRMRIQRITRSLLEALARHPGITLEQLAVEIGIEPNYLFRLLPRMAEQGLVARRGDRWYPAASARAAEGTDVGT